MLTRIKSLLPDRPVPFRVWYGPFRGARLIANPRSSVRKMLGLYEHELNGWLIQALPCVTRVLDVGANDGYFTFGCAAAFRRLGIEYEITSFEPQEHHVDLLRQSVWAQGHVNGRFEIVHAAVGRQVGPGMTTLDALPHNDRSRTLIKIDVEGAEVEVIAGATSWIHASNLFVIEVHHIDLLGELHDIFVQHGLTLKRVDQRALPLLGREIRQSANWWLVSAIGSPDSAA